MFTEKEKEVMKLRQKGLSQKEVAEKLKITQAAVSIFEKKIREKLKQALDALKIAEELGIVL